MGAWNNALGYVPKKFIEHKHVKIDPYYMPTCRICGKQTDGIGAICQSCREFIKQKKREEREKQHGHKTD